MILRNGHIECFKVITNAGVLPPIGGKDSNSWPFGMWVLKLRLIVGCWGCFRAAAGHRSALTHAGLPAFNFQPLTGLV
jgi:hypothetical protein